MMETKKAKPVRRVSGKRPISAISDKSKLPERRTKIYKKKRSKIPGIIWIVLIVIVVAISIIYILDQEGVTTPGKILKEVGITEKTNAEKIIGAWENSSNANNNLGVKLLFLSEHTFVSLDSSDFPTIGKWQVEKSYLFLYLKNWIIKDNTNEMSLEIIKLDSNILVVKLKESAFRYTRNNNWNQKKEKELLTKLDETLDNIDLESNSGSEIRDQVKESISKLETVTLQEWENLWEKRVKTLESMRKNGDTTVDIEDRRKQFDRLFEKYAVILNATISDISYATSIFRDRIEGLDIEFSLDLNDIEKNSSNYSWFYTQCVRVPESKRDTYTKGTQWKLIIRIKGYRSIDSLTSYNRVLDLDEDVLIEQID